MIAGATSVAVALLMAAAGLAVLFDRHVERVAAAGLSDRVEHLASAAELDPSGKLAMPAPPGDPLYQRPFSGQYWQIEAPGAMLRSRSLWDHVLDLPKAADAWVGNVEGPLNEHLLVLIRPITLVAPDGDVPVRIAVSMDRDHLDTARSAFLRDLAPYLGLLGVVLVAALAIAVAVALRPLAAVQDRVAGLTRQQRRRIGTDVPAEVLPLARQIDSLLERQESEVERARLRAGDLAHGLKTPLQALFGEATRLRMRGLEDAAEGIQEIARTMHAHVDRELAKARLASQTGRDSCNACEVAQSVAAVLRRTPAGAVLHIEVSGPAAVHVALNKAELTEALGALAENAVRHARTSVVIACAKEGATAVILIRDDGEGAAPELLDLLPHRGVRLDQRQGGTGLGLAIASDIVASVGGTLRLRNVDRGFEVAVTLPSVAGPAAG